MSDERKRPIWPWIAALMIGLPVLYVALFGPACWWMSPSPGPGPWRVAHAPQCFWPIGYVAVHGPAPLRHAIEWYGTAIGGWDVIFLTTDRNGTELKKLWMTRPKGWGWYMKWADGQL